MGQQSVCDELAALVVLGTTSVEGCGAPEVIGDGAEGHAVSGEEGVAVAQRGLAPSAHDFYFLGTAIALRRRAAPAAG